MSLKVSGRYSQAGWATELDLLREGRREGEREGGSEGERERKISYLKGRKVYLSLQCQPFPFPSTVNGLIALGLWWIRVSGSVMHRTPRLLTS